MRARLSSTVCTLALLGASASLLGCGDGEPPATDREPPLPEAAELLSAVDPMIGTGGDGFGVGSAYPGPAVPFAMIHPGPDTRSRAGAAGFYHCAGYYAKDSLLRGFSLVHFHGTGVPDYGTFGILPGLGPMTDAERVEEGRMIGFDKASEVARPGYYAVTLASGVRVELTSSERAGIFRFRFPEGPAPKLGYHLAHRLEGRVTEASLALEPSGGFSGRVRHLGPMSGRCGGYALHVRGQLDVAPRAWGLYDQTGLQPGVSAGQSTEGEVEAFGGYVELPPGTREATLRVAVSFVDDEGAGKNFAAEVSGVGFEAMQSAAEERWRVELSALGLHGPSDYDRRVMATALYHALLMPTLYSDVDGRFRRVDESVGQSTAPRYSDFSLWDTYRTLHPWLLLMEHPRATDFARSMVDLAREGGAVPVWAIAYGDSHTMIGSPGEVVLAESALKGVSFESEREAYALARVAAFGPSPGPVGGRGGDLDAYLQHGYVPADVSKGSVAKTQEYAVADAALGRWAARLGEAADAEQLARRGRGYARVYDASTGFFIGRNADGSWVPFSTPERQDSAYVEGNAWHYLWMVPHDPAGLAALLGGEAAALERLRRFFLDSEAESPVLGVRNHYWPSNEPDITAPWLFAAWGRPEESYRWVDWAVTELYTDGIDGIPGNDDGGTMSAWLLFASVGLYPIVGTDEYIVGIPRQRRTVLRRPSGALTIETSRQPERGLVLTRVLLDGEPLEGARVRHEQLVGTHTLRLELTR